MPTDRDAGLSISQLTIVLRCLMTEVANHMPAEQLREIGTLAGKRAGQAITPRSDLTIENFQSFAGATLASLGFEEVLVELGNDAIDFVHKGRDGRLWLGEGAAIWLPSFFEALYGEWIRQVGSMGRLKLSVSPDFGDANDSVRLRMARIA